MFKLRAMGTGVAAFSPAIPTSSATAAREAKIEVVEDKIEAVEKALSGGPTYLGISDRGALLDENAAETAAGVSPPPSKSWAASRPDNMRSFHLSIIVLTDYRSGGQPRGVPPRRDTATRAIQHMHRR